MEKDRTPKNGDREKPDQDLREVHPEDEERGQQIDPNRPNDRDD